MAISALATAGLKAGAAIGGGILQYSQNKKLADRQYKQQLDMWNKMNEYNAPVQQMARFKEAGLNPNLIYGQGTPGNATQMAKYQEQATDFQGAADQVGDAASNYFDTRLKQGQIDNQLKDLDVKEASIRATLAGAGSKEFDRQLKEDTRADMIRSSKAKADQAEQQLKISYQQEQNIRTERIPAIDPQMTDILDAGAREKYLSMVAHKAGGRVLDICCGSGWLALELGRRGQIVDAYDLSPKAIALAKKNSGGESF